MDRLQPVVERVRTFVETYGLYRKLYIEALFEGLEQVNVRRETSFGFGIISPRVALLHCSNCGDERTFDSTIGRYGSADGGARSAVPVNRSRGTSRVLSPGSEVETPKQPDEPVEARQPLISALSDDPEVHHVSMKCTYCMKARFQCWIEVRPNLGYIRKVGQLPKPGTSVAPELKLALGSDADIYRRALECINDSFGIGACSYLRRLLEDRVNPLLQLLLDIRRDEGALKDELDEIEDALTRTAFSEKAIVLYRKMPNSMKLEGDNPIKALYEGLSEGMHGLDEDGCTALAANGLSTFEYVARELSQEHYRMEAKKNVNKDVKSFRSLLGKLRADSTDEKGS